MTNYTLVLRHDGPGYNIRVIDADGAHHTMLGFKTEADAWTWIVHDQKIEEARARVEDADGWDEETTNDLGSDHGQLGAVQRTRKAAVWATDRRRLDSD